MATEYRAPLTFRGGGLNAERRLRVGLSGGGTAYSGLEMLLDEATFGAFVTGAVAASQAAQTCEASGSVTAVGTETPAKAGYHASRKVYIGVDLLPVAVEGRVLARQAPQYGSGRGTVAIVGKAVTMTAQCGRGIGEHSMDRRDERDLLELLRIIEYLNAA